MGQQLLTLIPGLCMILVAFIISKYPVNKKNFNRILFSIEQRKGGERVDVKKFDDIF